MSAARKPKRARGCSSFVPIEETEINYTPHSRMPSPSCSSFVPIEETEISAAFSVSNTAFGLQFVRSDRGN